MRFSTHQWWKTKIPLSNCFKIADRFKMAQFFRTATMITEGLQLWSQSSKKYLISEDCDYDRSTHKMITNLKKYTIYEDYNHDVILTKMSYFWVFIWLRSWSQSFLLGLWPWSRYSQNVLYFESLWGLRPQNAHFWVFVRNVIMIAVLIKCPISESSLIEGCNHESQSLYQHRHYRQISCPLTTNDP